MIFLNFWSKFLFGCWKGPSSSGFPGVFVHNGKTHPSMKGNPFTTNHSTFKSISILLDLFPFQFHNHANRYANAIIQSFYFCSQNAFFFYLSFIFPWALFLFLIHGLWVLCELLWVLCVWEIFCFWQVCAFYYVVEIETLFCVICWIVDRKM
jgi:hypothetical protein